MKTIATIISVVFLFSLAFAPALADGNDSVHSKNESQVMSGFVLVANTGSNEASGSYGGEGGNGGDIRNAYNRGYMPGPIYMAEVETQCHEENNNPDGDIEDSSTGNGGVGGNASDGGTVVTGDVNASLDAQTWVGRNTVEIDRCACEANNDDGNVRVRNINRTMLMSGAALMLNTGENFADGSYGGEGGQGGDIKNAWDGDVEGSASGSGADGGHGALGGLVNTGMTIASSSLVERVGENVTRISR